MRPGCRPRCRSGSFALAQPFLRSPAGGEWSARAGFLFQRAAITIICSWSLLVWAENFKHGISHSCALQAGQPTSPTTIRFTSGILSEAIAAMPGSNMRLISAEHRLGHGKMLGVGKPHRYCVIVDRGHEREDAAANIPGTICGRVKSQNVVLCRRRACARVLVLGIVCTSRLAETCDHIGHGDERLARSPMGHDEFD